MRWVCAVEIQGLYAAAARAAGLAAPGQPVVVIREGKVYDGCRDSFAAGLMLGGPAHQVLRDVPGAVRVEWSEIDAGPLARAWWDRCLAHTPYVEPVAAHSVLLALPSPEEGISRALQREVEALAEQAAAYGFVAFAGVGASRLVAQAAARTCKEGYLLRRPGMPGGPVADGRCIRFVPPGEEARFLAPLPLRYLPVSPDVRRRLARLGLRSIGEAARVPEAEWVRQLGPQGRQISLWSRGIDPEPVRPAYPPRRLTRRIEFDGEIRERDLLEQGVSRAARPLAQQLAARGEGCQLVALALELAGGGVLRAERTLQRLQHTLFPLQQGLLLLLDGLLKGLAEAPAVTALTAEVGQIGPIDWRPMDLWDDRLRRERRERTEQALALLRERFPSRVIGLGPRTEVSWREQMLQFADPYRWPRGGEAEWLASSTARSM